MTALRERKVFAFAIDRPARAQTCAARRPCALPADAGPHRLRGADRRRGAETTKPPGGAGRLRRERIRRGLT
ncbi:hypothetical protein [Lysobacter sp. yr284]|uniref:hypothetical protein n=1 Tax=Lysobacter sp. yr284 TaxID=1761791 RepID=UPI0011141E2C|nr:hypothetical protein [Lysobacter sp. yr284]